MYEIFEHTADLGLRMRATDVDSLFAEAGRALLAAIVANPEDVRGVKEVSYELDADGLDYLLLDWLTELLFTFESRRLLLAEFDVRIANGSLKATARGEPLDAERHKLDHEVKAITYHELKVQETGGEWLAEVVVDI